MKYLFLFLISLILLSCESYEPKYYRSRFYPIKNEKSIWYQDAFFINSPPFFRLESRFYAEDPAFEGYFEPIDIRNTQLYLDRDIILKNDTISKFTNLLSINIAEIKLRKQARGGGFIDDSYVITINNNNLIDIKTNNGYYTVYIKATTEKQYLINDSTVICVEYK